MSKKTNKNEQQRKQKGIAKFSKDTASKVKRGRIQKAKEPQSMRTIEEVDQRQSRKEKREIKKSQSQQSLNKFIQQGEKPQKQIEQEKKEKKRNSNKKGKKESSHPLAKQIQSIVSVEKENPEIIKQFSSKALEGKIKASYRLKLFEWMVEICWYKGANRFSLALGQHLFDLVTFFSPQPIKTQEIQKTGVGCLSIAIKFEEFYKNKDFGCFSPQQVREAELKVSFSLQFRFKYRTYFTILNEMIDSWDHFVLSQSTQNFPSYLVYRSGDFNKNTKVIDIYNKAVLINSVLFSLQYSSIDLSINLIYLDIFRRISQNENAQFKESDLQKLYKDQISKIFRNKKLQSLFSQFHNYCKLIEREKGQIKLEICQYLCQFVMISANSTITHFKNANCQQNILLIRRLKKQFQQTENILQRETQSRNKKSIRNN